MRKEFGRVITELASRDDRVLLIVGDIGFGIFDSFRKAFPNRFLNVGICEQSMISLASGLALQGWKPWVYTITPFLIERPFEQVKLDIDQQNVNVKLVGYADYPHQGPTHAEIDAPYIMKMFNNIKSYFPKNNESVIACMALLSTSEGPGFISLKKAPEN